MLEEWLSRLIKTVWLTDCSCSSVRDCRAKTLQEQKREYKYVEWKLCEANPLCALFIWYCRWKTKKVVLLCIHILIFYCAFNFNPPPPDYKVNATTRQFHLLCLNAFINASPTLLRRNPHAKKVCHKQLCTLSGPHLPTDDRLYP